MISKFRIIFEEVQSKYWGNRAAGAFFYCQSTRSVLWAKRSAKGVKEPSTWSVTFGGKCEKGEDPKESAIREVIEETKFNKKFHISTKPVFVFHDEKEKFKYFTYQMTVDYEFSPTLNWEHTEFMWLPLGKTPDGKIHFGSKDLIKNNII
jgi:8-oxo-dGTP pyrophosphatase MutT (NUDIX family)